MSSFAFNEPILACDSHHGVYAFQLLFLELRQQPIYYYQMYAQLCAYDIMALAEGPDNERYWDASENLEQCTFVTKDNQEFSIVSNEDLWFVPKGFDCEDWFI